MKQRHFTLWLAIALLGGLIFIAGCNDATTGDSAAEAASQLGLGGDDLSRPSQGLEVMAEGAQLGVWTSDYPAAQKLAQEQELPMLLFFNGSDWSISSNQLIQNVFADQEWLNFLSNLVLVYLDFPRHNPKFPAELKEQNDALRLQFAVRDFPTLLLCTSEGQLAGNLRVNSQSKAHDLVRNIKLFRRRIPSEIDKLVARTNNPVLQENYATFKATSEARQKLLEETQAKMKEMEETMMRLGTQIEEDIIAWEIAQHSSEDQQAYQQARAAQKAVEEQLTEFMQTNPARSPENQQKFQEFQTEIQRQQLIIDEIIAK